MRILTNSTEVYQMRPREDSRRLIDMTLNKEDFEPFAEKIYETGVFEGKLSIDEIAEGLSKYFSGIGHDDKDATFVCRMCQHERKEDERCESSGFCIWCEKGSRK